LQRVHSFRGTTCAEQRDAKVEPEIKALRVKPLGTCEGCCCTRKVACSDRLLTVECEQKLIRRQQGKCAARARERLLTSIVERRSCMTKTFV
jgi:hypothetical protein